MLIYFFLQGVSSVSRTNGHETGICLYAYLVNLQSMLILAEKLIRKQIHLFISVFANEFQNSTVIQTC